MASSPNRPMCEKECTKFEYVSCGGCYERLCRVHFLEHREVLTHWINDLAGEHDEIQQDVMNEETNLPALLDRIDIWEKRAIETIQKTAEAVRRDLQNHFHQTKERIKTWLKNLSEELKTDQSHDEFTEIELKNWEKRLEWMRQQLQRLATVKIVPDEDEMLSSISLIRAKFIERNTVPPIITETAQWHEKGVTVVGQGSENDDLSKILDQPYGLDIDDEQTLFISDLKTHQVIAYGLETEEVEVVAGGKGQGTGTDQLHNPLAVLIDRITDSLIVSDSGNQRVMRWSRQNRSPEGEIILSNITVGGLALDDQGFLYVSDTENHEVRRYGQGDTEGVVIAGGFGQGSAPNQLDTPRQIFVDQDHGIYVSDTKNHRVMKWPKYAKIGIVVAGGHGPGNSNQHLNEPRGIFVDANGSVYVVERSNNRIVRWPRGAREGQVVIGASPAPVAFSSLFGGTPSSRSTNSLNQPTSLAFDQQGRLYVADPGNRRIERFDMKT